MSHVKIWVHAVWGTKSHFPYLTKEIKEKIISHIRENANNKGIYVNKINGHRDHLHALIGLNADKSIAQTMQLIKGECAFWINKNKITSEKFEWADEYFAASVSESDLDRVVFYINNQEEHHKKSTFMEEYEKFMKDYNKADQG